MQPLIATALGAVLALGLTACTPGSAPASESDDDGPHTVNDPAASTPSPQETASAEDPEEGDHDGSSDWRTVALADDADRIARIDSAWRDGLAEARLEHAAEVAALGALADPAAAQTGRVQPPPGTYRCRSIRFGSQGGGGLGYLAYPWFRCSVELTPGGDLILTKTTGSQRTRGRLFPDSDNRLVYVGAQAWGMDETGYPEYGAQPERNHVGVLERIGDQRWRLVIPWPRQESKLEIIELAR